MEILCRDSEKSFSFSQVAQFQNLVHATFILLRTEGLPKDSKILSFHSKRKKMTIAFLFLHAQLFGTTIYFSKDNTLQANAASMVHILV